MSAATPPFDPVALLRVLDRHGVRYVVIGGYAAVVHGSPLPTEDVDITPERSGDNLDRLSAQGGPDGGDRRRPGTR